MADGGRSRSGSRRQGGAAAPAGEDFPIRNYDDLPALAILEQLARLTPAQLIQVEHRERQGARRPTILLRLAHLMAESSDAKRRPDTVGGGRVGRSGVPATGHAETDRRDGISAERPGVAQPDARRPAHPSNPAAEDPTTPAWSSPGSSPAGTAHGARDGSPSAAEDEEDDWQTPWIASPPSTAGAPERHDSVGGRATAGPQDQELRTRYVPPLGPSLARDRLEHEPVPGDSAEDDWRPPNAERRPPSRMAYNPPNAPHDRPMPIHGVVANIRERSRWVPYISFEGGFATPSQAPVLRFLVNRYDDAGNSLSPIAVEVRWYRHEPLLAGDEVEVTGKYNKGILRADKVVVKGKDITLDGTMFVWMKILYPIFVALMASALVILIWIILG